MVSALRFAGGYWGLAILLAVLGATLKTQAGWNVGLEVVAGVLALAGGTVLVGTWWRTRAAAADDRGAPADDRTYADMIITGVPNQSFGLGPGPSPGGDADGT